MWQCLLRFVLFDQETGIVPVVTLRQPALTLVQWLHSLVQCAGGDCDMDHVNLGTSDLQRSLTCCDTLIDQSLPKFIINNGDSGALDCSHTQKRWPVDSTLLR